MEQVPEMTFADFTFSTEEDESRIRKYQILSNPSFIAPSAGGEDRSLVGGFGLG